MTVYDVVAVNCDGQTELTISTDVATLSGAQACAAGFNGHGSCRLVAVVRERRPSVVELLEPSRN